LGFFAIIRSFPSTELAVKAVANGGVDLVLIAIEDSVSGLLAEPLRSVIDRGLFPVAEVVEYTGEQPEVQVATRFLAMGRMSCDPTGLDRTLLMVAGDREMDPVAGFEDRSVRTTFLDSGGRNESDTGRWVVMIDGHFKDDVTAEKIANFTVRRGQVTVIGSWPVVEQSLLDE
jgi:prephenate dehydratase